MLPAGAAAPPARGRRAGWGARGQQARGLGGGAHRRRARGGVEDRLGVGEPPRGGAHAGAQAHAGGARERGAQQPRGRRRAVRHPLGRFLAQQRTDEAILLFEFNTQAFPTVANTWDSLGEAQAQAGLTESAIESYSKALELDPESVTAPPMLAQLERLVGASAP